MKRRFFSIQSKYIVSGVTLIVVLVALIEVCVYTVLAPSQMEDAKRQSAQLIATIGKSFDDMNRSFKSSINFITMDAEFQALLGQAAEGAGDFGEMNVKLKKHLTDRAILIDEVDALYLYDARGQLRTFWHKRNLQRESFVLFPHIEAAWFSPIGRVTCRMIGGRLLYTRQINDMWNLKTRGYLLAIYDPAELQERVSTVVPDAQRLLLVLDQHGEVVTHNFQSQEQLAALLSRIDFENHADGSILQAEGMEKSLLAQSVSAETGWRTVSIMAVDRILHSSQLALNIVLGLGALGVLIGVAVQVLISRRIVRPLLQMVDTVRGADAGDYSRRIDIKTGDELSILAASFNQMLATTDNLVNQVLLGEIKYRDSQIAALQAQINPHLLHNTLECINWLAEFGRKEDIRSVTIAFSHLMKALSSGPMTVPLREELSYTEDFLHIYKTLLCGKLSYTIDVSDVSPDTPVPRLTIQPLVENAVLHGVKRSLRDGHIHVSVSAAEQGLLISIVDDGAGMSEETMDRINRYAQGNLPEEEAGTLGLGIRNVIHRIQLLYPGKTVFSVNSSEWGTAVDMLLPLAEKEESP